MIRKLLGGTGAATVAGSAYGYYWAKTNSKSDG